ncbi:D-sedoheptulose-7-phosphate isomerase [Marinitenerispora sediminis]|uniref:D-sedoheptulose-7-phosphate isomerase n=1 Tax=Marinitenerispora sediminis TaxID=1931232 RepID=UPI000DF1DB45|nr:SIS domain-containing protein [Marinitenerispora sediminis]RCV47852.1 phosphoheptose isomerase [Marinitenerispora sediminis]
MHQHLTELQRALRCTDTGRVEDWGRRLAAVLLDGGRLLACGNGGSTAEAQHLTAELVGRFEDERRPLSAIALHADTSSLTALANDYGYRDVYARQVRAHARPGDVLVCLSTSGASENVVAAALAARELGVRTWALTGEGPSALLAACDEAVQVPAAAASTVQEVHLALVHLLCSVVDAEVRHRAGAVPAAGREEVQA